MEGIHSFEKRSVGDADKSKANRVIIVDRCQPNAYWSTPNQPVKSRSSIWSSLKTICCCCCSVFSKSRQSLREFRKRRVDSLASLSLVEDISIDSGPFPSNELITSKYSLWNFLPKNLFEQFRRLANLYFLVTGILQLVLPFSPVGPATSLTPLVFVVSTTAIKQAYEDYLRHKLDREVNNRMCHVLINKKLVKIRSKDIRVGNIVYVKINEEIPCDMILLATSGSGDRCYVTTANLDGETSLKGRTCFVIRSLIGTIEDIDQTLLVVECEQPNATLYEFNGALRAPKDKRDYNRLVCLADHQQSAPMSLGANHHNQAPDQQSSNPNPKNSNDADNNAEKTTTGSGGGGGQLVERRDSIYPIGAGQCRGPKNDEFHLVTQQIYRQIRKTNLHLTQRAPICTPLQAKSKTIAMGANKQEQLVEKSSEYTEVILDISNLLLRASRLRNTSFVYGLVVHTGADTKLAHNSQVKPNKFSSTESRVNVFLVLAFLLLVALTLISAIYKSWFHNQQIQATNNSTTTTAPDKGPKTFVDNLLAHFLLYNYIVPISLYVTLEFIKFFGTMAVINDKKLRSSVWKTISNAVTGSSFESKRANQVGGHQQQAISQSKSKTHPSASDTNQAKLSANLKSEQTTKTATKSLIKSPIKPPTKPTPTQTQTQTQPQHPDQTQFRRVQVLERPQCNSSDLNEDLGQVEVLVTDKTGTLTENKMRFMACSIYGHLYRCVSNKLYQQPAGWCQMAVPNLTSKLATITNNRYAAIGPSSATSASRVGPTAGAAKKSPRSCGGSQGPTSISSQMNKLNARERPFDHRFVPPLSELKLASTNLEQHEKVVEFFICLCLCSTITLNETTPLADCLPDKMTHDFQSASPDEESLISAAALFGITMCKSNERECFIAIRRSSPAAATAATSATVAANGTPTANQRRPAPSQQQACRATGQFRPIVETKHSNDKFVVRHFERLVALEFNSTRKRMSVIYRDCDNECKLIFTKGSESVLDCVRMRSLSAASELCINVTLAHFEAFAKSGLRTMLVAKRQVSSAEYERIINDLGLIRLAGVNRDQMLESLYRRVEINLQFVGTTAVEDTLQEGVPETIADLKEAGIRVWLLTGDKVETAVSVAYLCKLLDRDMSLLYLVRQRDSSVCRETLETIAAEVASSLAACWQTKRRSAGRNASERTPKSVTGSGGRHQAANSLPPSPPTEYNANHEAAKSPQFAASKSSLGSTLAKRLHGSKLSSSLPPPPPAVGKLSSQIRQKSVAAGPVVTLADEKQQQQQPPPPLDGPAIRYALIVDGRSLHYAMKYARDELELVCKSCVCVLGCRLSPLQKAEVVGMLKSGHNEPITAAIGDGANDVSMIQEAHVGIGISGKEGRQAVNSSDFAIKRFHMLSRLFLVHGHLFYYRTANTIHYFFYKNILFIIPQFIYSFYNPSPARSIYQPIMLVTYNLFFTSIPILLYGLLERHVHEDRLEQQPKLYRLNRQNYQLRLSAFFAWSLLAVLQGTLVSYWLAFIWAHGGSGTRVFADDEDNLMIGFSTILYFVIVLGATIKLYLLAKDRNIYFNLASLATILVLPLFFYIISIVDLTLIFGVNSFHQKFSPLIRSPLFWLGVASTTVALTIPDILFTYLFY